MDIATKQDIEQIVDQKIDPLRKDLIRAIGQIGKPERMTTREVAKELGVCDKTAIKRMKDLYQQGKLEKVDFDSKPITVNRKDFFKAINQ